MAAWTYSDWVTKADGTQDRLDRLRLHIQEVSDSLKDADFNVTERAENSASRQKYLAELHEREKEESEKVTTARGTRVGWTRGKAIL